MMTGEQSQTGFLDVQGAPLYYEVAGTGYPLLLIHEGVADCRMWDQLVIPGAAHVINMEQPAEFNRIVLDFLAHIPG
jgi:pimeloyl-ACP methyl ester carboxylesterase